MPVLLIAAALIGVVAIEGTSRKGTAAVAPTVSGTKVIAYYFHVTVRCTTCRTIESYSREVVERKFAAEIARGRLEFKTVNVQLPENRHLIKEYQLFTKSLVLTRFENGEQAEFKVLNDTWELVGDKQAMQGYVERELREYLKRLV